MMMISLRWLDILGHIAAIARGGLLLQTEQRGPRVCVCVRLSVGHVREPFKMAEPIEMPIGG